MTIERRRLLVRGVIQGVGFRPFVYRLAVGHGLGGSVSNRGDAGVEINVEGETAAIEAFIGDLRKHPPPLARVDFVDSFIHRPIGEETFSILPSKQQGQSVGTVPPDIGICGSCVRDLQGDTRYHGYWATNCTDCGPRFTVIEVLPYDRPRTSMRDFPMCEECEAEYLEPSNRRYHAQTIACPRCGPVLTFDGEQEDPIESAAAALRAGRIVAIKGIGGTHLACDAVNEQAVARLRRRLGRPFQPFALMATEVMLPQFARVMALEWDILQNPRRPIVILCQKKGVLPRTIAPGLHTVGVMLPYTGLHHLLFDRLEGPLVMTSANLPGRPMLIDNEEILKRLSDVADHFLLHDRQIIARCDDSVLRRSGGTMKFIRRSRGYVPESILLDLGSEPILALGAETDLAFAIYADRSVALSQHIGNVDDLETYSFFTKSIDHLYRLLRPPLPRIVVCDLHPSFLTTRHAEVISEETGATIVRAQHHEAHLASVMGEHHLVEAVGIILDVFGYGRDGNAWGGEILLARGDEIKRCGSLFPVPLPGGDLAARYPLRMVASFLHCAGTRREEIARLLKLRGTSDDEIAIIFGQLETNWNAVLTTSAGRFLDAVATLIGVCQKRTYEGEPAKRLEAVASQGTPIELPIEVKKGEDRLLFNTVDLYVRLADLAKRKRPETVAATAQASLARGMAKIALMVAGRESIEAIALSGGVAYNDAVVTTIRSEIERAGCAFFTNEQVPCGDGGVAFGQVVYAACYRRLLSRAPRPDATTSEQRQCCSDCKE
jgi:hydrogenase maturation protein HypF